MLRVSIEKRSGTAQTARSRHQEEVHPLMRDTSSQNQREPVISRGRRVPCLYVRPLADGSERYEFVGRLRGRVRTVRLQAITKLAAIDEAESLRAGVRERRLQVPPDQRITVSELARRFLAAVERDPVRSPRTVDHLRSRLELHVIPAIGSLKAADVDERTVRDLAAKLTRNGAAASTVRGVGSALSQTFRWALAERLVSHNPVRLAREAFPRELAPRDAAPYQARALTDEEISAALGNVGETYRPVVAFMAETGCRVSEAVAMRWQDVDLRRGVWTVAGQLHDGKVRPAKTAASTTTVPISDEAVRVLREHRQELARKRGLPAVHADRFVFQTRSGRPHSRRNVGRAWHEALADAGISGAHLHSLRTSFVSRLLARGVDPARVSALARHSRVTTTLDVYARVQGGDVRRLETLRDALTP
jgi:integrase